MTQTAFTCRLLSPTGGCLLMWFVLAAMSLLATRADAAGGPENVLLVVNPRSPDSLCIANHFAALRHIPVENFLFRVGSRSKRRPTSPRSARKSSFP